MHQRLLELQVVMLNACLSSCHWRFALQLADDDTRQAVSSSLARAAYWATALSLLPGPVILASAVTALEAQGMPQAVPALLERLSQNELLRASDCARSARTSTSSCGWTSQSSPLFKSFESVLSTLC